MRYQVVVLASEIGDAIEIESLSWIRGLGGEPQGTFDDFALYMGLCSSNELGLAYDDNYIPGTRILVMSSSSLTTPTVNPNEWFDTTLDTPFWYNGEDNLIIEIEWSNGLGSLYTWHWDGGGLRCVVGSYGEPNGSYSTNLVPNIRLNGILSLSGTTFGRIKAAFI